MNKQEYDKYIGFVPSNISKRQQILGQAVVLCKKKGYHTTPLYKMPYKQLYAVVKKLENLTNNKK